MTTIQLVGVSFFLVRATFSWPDCTLLGVLGNLSTLKQTIHATCGGETCQATQKGRDWTIRELCYTLYHRAQDLHNRM